jgi:glycosyltransferase involved in cell wall biosynthesis
MMTRSEALRVGLIADITGSIPPALYGGVERIVHLVLEGLVQRGHEVTLFASDDSNVNCRLVPFGHRRTYSRLGELRTVSGLYRRLWKFRKDFDIVHCFGRTLYLTPLLPLGLPKIQTYQCPVDRRKLRWANQMSAGTLTFTACSQSTAMQGNGIGKWEVIPNGVPLGVYQYRDGSEPREYLAFLGRLDRIKGLHTAITVSRATGLPLVIAGNVARDGENFEYFKRAIEPQIDNVHIRYVGPLNDQQKNDFLGKARALLFPIEWEEPFGIVMAEAMACGTPVIAFRRGAVPEVITHGVDGFVCDSIEEMIAAVNQLEQLDRLSCRKKVERSFADDVIVSQYLSLYRRLTMNGST